MQLNYKLLGSSGPPIVILHGLFGMLDNWQTIGRWLAKEYQVYLVDQRNHGRSPHDPELSYPLMAADLEAFLTEQSIYKATVLGHSMGGKTALQFAVDFPDRLESLVVADMGIKSFPGGHDDIFKALFALDVGKIESRKEAEQELMQLIPEFGVRQFLLKNLSRNKEGGYRWKMNLEAIHQNYANVLAEIAVEDFSFDGPALFIRGTQSGYVTDEDWPSIQAHFPLAQLRDLDAGHWLHAEQPEAFYNELSDFLRHL